MDEAIITACKLLGIDPELEAIEGYGEAEIMQYATIIRESFPAPSEPIGEEAFAQAVGEVLRKEHAFDNDEVIEVLSGASALLTSRPAPTDEKALRAFEKWWRLHNAERTIEAIEPAMRLCLEALSHESPKEEA